MNRLFVVDVASLGHHTGPGSSTSAILASLAPPAVPPGYVAHTVCRVLHRASKLTDGIRQDVCDSLLIDASQWPDPWPHSSFCPGSETVSCLARLRQHGPVVALTNSSITSTQARLGELTESCGDFFDAVYTSNRLGACKPARWIWGHIAERHNVDVRRVINIGNRWTADVLGPFAAGASSVWINKRNLSTPPNLSHEVVKSFMYRWMIAGNLAEAVAIATSTWPTP
jgi:hypothetical protein